MTIECINNKNYINRSYLEFFNKKCKHFVMNSLECRIENLIFSLLILENHILFLLSKYSNKNKLFNNIKHSIDRFRGRRDWTQKYLEDA